MTLLLSSSRYRNPNKVVKTMLAKISQRFCELICLLILGITPGFAQAVFSVSSSAVPAADIGCTEATGSITLTVVSGTTVAAPVQITYPAQITDNYDTDILVVGSGILAGISPVPQIDRNTNSIKINVPAGGVAGNIILVSKVRLAIFGSSFTHVTASISSPVSPGNTFVAGQTNPIVISSITQPFSINQSEKPPLEYANGLAVNATSFFTISEGYPGAFTDTVGVAGQTVPTRIRITPFPPLPSGIHVTFEAVAGSFEIGATLTTLSGNAETIPRADGSSDVVYQFTGTEFSSITPETFHFTVGMTVETTASGIIRFQAELIPTGLATPNAEYPSRDIPRYIERLVPDEADLMTGSTDLVFPFRKQSDLMYTGIALTNPQNYRVRATFTAYDTHGIPIEGDNITNPVTIILPRKGQYPKVDSEIFGPDYNASSPGIIRVIGQTNQLDGFYLTGDISGPKFDGCIADAVGISNWYLPTVFHQGAAPFNLLEIFNPGDSTANLTMRLRDENGIQVATASKTMQAGTSIFQDVDEAFGVVLSSFSGGYVTGQSDQPLVVRNTFGNELESNALVAQPAQTLNTFYTPQFATGGQYSTELTIVNTDLTYSADVTMTLLDGSGTPLAIAGNPLSITIGPEEQQVSTLADLFPALGSSLITGSIKFVVRNSFRGPFLTTPAIAGSIRFSNSDGTASAALPLSVAPAKGFVYSHVAQSAGYFTGVAAINPNSTSASVTLEVYGKDGTLVGSYPFTLAPSARISRLVYEMVPDSVGQGGGYIKVTSNVPLTSFALFGTNDLRSLSTIPPQALQ
jgi:hypothetical protein